MSAGIDLPILGRLRIVEVFDFYDEPTLYSCQDSIGHLYLAICADMDAVEGIWYYAPISQTRLSQVRSGAIDLHDAFAEAEQGWFWEVRQPHDIGCPVPEPRIIQCRDANPDVLPLAGPRLSLPTATLPALAPDLSQRAHQMYREHVEKGREQEQAEWQLEG